jgi:preprotein translocase subunit SecA
MKDYYSTLEVAREASVGEIKRAYFGLVRKYPPDRYPEEFMKIREAYEVLSDERTRKQYDNVETMPEIVKRFFGEGKEAFEMGDYDKAIALLEHVTKLYPGFSVVEGLLGEIYRANGNSVKCIKIFEELVSKEPQNAGFSGKLAHAYNERGWRKKAVKQYKHALKLDEDNISLWLGLINCYLKSKDIRSAKKVVFEALEVSNKKGWDNLELYYHIIQMDIFTGELEQLKQHVEEMKEKAEESDISKSNVAWFLAEISLHIKAFGLNEQAELLVGTAVSLMPDDEEIKGISNKIKPTGKEYESLELLSADDSVDGTFDEMFEAELEKCDCTECMIDRFKMELVIVTNIKETRKEILIIKKKYPELYKLKESFFNKVLDPKRESRLIEDCLKQYKKYSTLYPEFFEEYEDDDEDEDFDFYEEQQPMVRAERKIGRNEPCPCGSGKKYKKCCGK